MRGARDTWGGQHACHCQHGRTGRRLTCLALLARRVGSERRLVVVGRDHRRGSCLHHHRAIGRAGIAGCRRGRTGRPGDHQCDHRHAGQQDRPLTQVPASSADTYDHEQRLQQTTRQIDRVNQTAAWPKRAASWCFSTFPLSWVNDDPRRLACDAQKATGRHYEARAQPRRLISRSSSWQPSCEPQRAVWRSCDLRRTPRLRSQAPA